MNRLPNNIEFLAVDRKTFFVKEASENSCLYGYIYKVDDKCYPIYLTLPIKEEDRIEKYNIVDESNNYINGFKLIRNAYSQYLYKKEETEEVLPYVFDVATDFNEYGLAMVGIRNSVFWINKKFEYFDGNGLINKLDPTAIETLTGYNRIDSFSKNKNPVSRCYGSSTDLFKETTRFMTPNLSTMYFREWTGDGTPGFGEDVSDKFDGLVPQFNDKGYTIVNEENSSSLFKILSADTSCYITGDTILKWLNANGLLYKYCFEKVIQDGLIDQLIQMSEDSINYVQGKIDYIPYRHFGPPQTPIEGPMAPICVIEENKPIPDEELPFEVDSVKEDYPKIKKK